MTKDLLFGAGRQKNIFTVLTISVHGLVLWSNWTTWPGRVQLRYFILYLSKNYFGFELWRLNHVCLVNALRPALWLVLAEKFSINLHPKKKKRKKFSIKHSLTYRRQWFSCLLASYNSSTENWPKENSRVKIGWYQTTRLPVLLITHYSFTLNDS